MDYTKGNPILKDLPGADVGFVERGVCDKVCACRGEVGKGSGRGDAPLPDPSPLPPLLGLKKIWRVP